MKYIRLAMIVIMIIFVSNSYNLAQADSYSHTIEVFRKSPGVQPFFENAYGYAVFPTVGKGGIGIGGAYGKGRVYRGGVVTGTTSLTKATIGFQFGGEAFSEIIFFQDKRAYDEFTRGNFEFDAAASAVAILSGAQANYTKGMAVFVHTKDGLMYEAPAREAQAIGGQKFSFKAQ